MQKQKPAESGAVLEALWKIGDTANLRQYRNYRAMLSAILRSKQIDPRDQDTPNPTNARN
jgi:hypothetical protein